MMDPLREMAAYEALWEGKTTTFKSLAKLFASYPGSRPSDFVSEQKISEFHDFIIKMGIFSDISYQPHLLINRALDYPKCLRDAKEPVELLYYTGNLDLMNTRRISIIGTRKPSKECLQITDDITTRLVSENFTIVSGLASGIDTQTHKSAIAANGRTIAIMGTPLNKVYPRENSDLKIEIANNHLLISQVPFYRYTQHGPLYNKLFFIERNKTMSALTEATLIIEANDTSGTLTQAKAALYQKKKLLIWETCFNSSKWTWSARFLKKGAIRVRNIEEIRNVLTI